MIKVSDLIIPLYKAAIPLCERRKISLNLDLTDPTATIKAERRELNQVIKPHILSAIQRTKNGTITIGTKTMPREVEIYIKDSGDALLKAEREELANDITDVHSRHGYGTTITLHFKK